MLRSAAVLAMRSVWSVAVRSLDRCNIPFTCDRQLPLISLNVEKKSSNGDVTLSILSRRNSPVVFELVRLYINRDRLLSGHVSAGVRERLEHPRTLRVRPVLLGRLRGCGWALPGR